MKICKVKNCEREQKTKEYCGKHYMQLWEYGKILKRTKRDPNKIVDCGDYYEICIYNIKQKEIARAKIDKDDLDKAKQYKWHLNDQGYIIHRYKRTIRLHKLILGKKEGYEIDHINHDTLDNRKQNLRFATRSENNKNRKALGIVWLKYRKKWLAKITINYKIINLGCFNRREDAIKARRIGELKYYGEFSYKEEQDER